MPSAKVLQRTPDHHTPVSRCYGYRFRVPGGYTIAGIRLPPLVGIKRYRFYVPFCCLLKLRLHTYGESPIIRFIVNPGFPDFAVFRKLIDVVRIYKQVKTFHQQLSGKHIREAVGSLDFPDLEKVVTVEPEP